MSLNETFRYLVSFTVERKRPFLWFEQTWFTTERRYVTGVTTEEDAIKNAKAYLPGDNIRNVTLVGVAREVVPEKEEEKEPINYRVDVKTVIASQVGPGIRMITESYCIDALDEKEAQKRALMENDLVIDRRLSKLGIPEPSVRSTEATVY